jgi:prepilin-type N-terminal cleavage/methylation domain-containing protein
MDNLYTRVSRRRRRGQEGFTLIELLVVIAVLAILAGIVIFNVTGVANRGSLAACQTDLKTIQTASDAFYNDSTPRRTWLRSIPRIFTPCQPMSAT